MVELSLILLAVAIRSDWRRLRLRRPSAGQMFFAAALREHLVGTVVGRAMVERRGIQ
jgi:hypothetical protein